MKTPDRESHYPPPWNLSPLNILKDLPGKRNFQFSLWFNLSSLLSSQFELDPEADTIQPFLFEGNSPHLPVGGRIVLSQVLVFPMLGTAAATFILRHLSGVLLVSPIHESLHLSCCASLDTGAATRGCVLLHWGCLGKRAIWLPLLSYLGLSSASSFAATFQVWRSERYMTE